MLGLTSTQGLFLSMLGSAVLFVGIIMLLANAVRKKGLRTWAIVAGVGYIILMISSPRF